ncbi:GNAT family N-acetyltransferase [Kineococcus sp. SYSU DK002]|uniref:GNAT family N-acetyltransferase n=1 Tax=Kineococcus sp. SYSU DK002 TaxID=3383123 RepID=UPI003D7CB723
MTLHAEHDVLREPFAVLRDEVVVLHCLRPQDAEAHLAGEDEGQVRWLNEGHHSTLERVSAWIGENHGEWTDDGPRRHFGIFDRATKTLVGGVEANLGLLDGAPERVNLSYAVFPAWRGRGLAARAVLLVGHWLADRTPARTAVLRIEPGNDHSHRVAVACGFTRTGVVLADEVEFVCYERSLKDEMSG